MSWTPARSLVLAAAAVVLPSAVSGQLGSQHCSEVCTPTTSCDQSCRLQTGPFQPDEEWSTCGEWGTCDAPCEPDWQVISTESKGGYAVNYFTLPLRCEFYGTYLITERDMNQCGEPDRSWCFWQLEGTRDDHRCCEFFFCSANACHQP